MSHNKRFRSAIAVVLILLLTVAAAPVASAVEGEPEPPSPDIPIDSEDPPPDPPGPHVPVDPPEPPDPTLPGNGNMTDDDEDMMSTPSSHSWPPPNAIVKHAATPVQISVHGGTLNVYLIAPDGAVTSGPAIATISDLAEMHPSGGAVSLYSGINAASGKSVVIDYLPDEMKIRVSTFYADKPPHDYNKPYVFTVDADHSVTHEQW